MGVLVMKYTYIKLILILGILLTSTCMEVSREIVNNCTNVDICEK